MNNNEVKDLLAQFDQSTLTEFDLREGSFELYMNKNNEVRKSVQTTNVETAAVIEQSIEDSSTEVVETKTEIKKTTAVSDANQTNSEAIVSPIVGIVYLKPAPDKENFKQVGDQVKKGEVVCIVEAMKLMNEITATVDGTITEIVVQDEEVVEYNQPLFHVAKGV